MATLYYWFKGAPEDRPGGPWWHREFDLQADLHRWLDDVKPFLQKHVIEEDHDCCRVCDRHYPNGDGSMYLQRIWMANCNYQSDGWCNKCGLKHEQTYEEAHGAGGPLASG